MIYEKNSCEVTCEKKFICKINQFYNFLTLINIATGNQLHIKLCVKIYVYYFFIYFRV